LGLILFKMLKICTNFEVVKLHSPFQEIVDLRD
jgi:hypothetical protein